MTIETSATRSIHTSKYTATAANARGGLTEQKVDAESDGDGVAPDVLQRLYEATGGWTPKAKLSSMLGVYLEMGVAATSGDGGRPNRCMKDDRICSGLRSNRA